MKLQIWQRQDPVKGKVYDVHVINDPNPNSNYHAGGMPAEWLILHCVRAEYVRKKFPNAKRADGTPLVKGASGDMKAKETEADIDIELIVKKALIAKHLKDTEAAASKSDPTGGNTSPPANVKSEAAAEVDKSAPTKLASIAKKE